MTTRTPMSAWPRPTGSPAGQMACVLLVPTTLVLTTKLMVVLMAMIVLRRCLQLPPQPHLLLSQRRVSTLPTSTLACLAHAYTSLCVAVTPKHTPTRAWRSIMAAYRTGPRGPARREMRRAVNAASASSSTSTTAATAATAAATTAAVTLPSLRDTSLCLSPRLLPARHSPRCPLTLLDLT
jgi:hypothetical protein